MENNRELLEKLERNSRQQLLFTQILCGLCAAVVICVLVLTVSVTGAVNELMLLADPLQELTAQVQILAKDAGNVMVDLAAVAEELATADLSGIVENVNNLTLESQNAIGSAMTKLDSIDIATLNKAIKDLSSIVELLSKVTSIFGR